MSRIGILGGTFDPPHNGHIAVARAALKEFNLQKVLFIPAKYPPHKPVETVTSEKDRLNMLQLALRDIPEFEISDIELVREGLSYSVDTLREIKKLYKNMEIIFIIGADNISEMESWYRPDEIFKYATVVSFNRPGYESRGKYKMKIRLFNMQPVDVSSTDIRERVGAGRSIEGLVSDPVREYIEKNKLYGNK